MKNLGNILYIDRFPSLDLHGFTRDIATLSVNDFIKDNIKLKNEIVVIIHGIGTGILKEAVIKTLKANKNVLEFATYYNNSGCTVVRLKI